MSFGFGKLPKNSAHSEVSVFLPLNAGRFCSCHAFAVQPAAPVDSAAGPDAGTVGVGVTLAERSIV